MKCSLPCAVAIVLSSVCASGADLPAGYTGFSGVTADGNQYIYTDFVPDSTDTIEAKVVFTDVSSTYNVWCARKGMSENSQTVFLIGGNLRFDRRTANVTASGVIPSAGDIYILRAEYGTLNIVINGVTNSTKMASGDFTQESRLSFFSSHTNGSGFSNKAHMTLCWARVYASDGTLKREYLPAMDSSNELGLYETQKGGFFKNIGSGTFKTWDEPSISWYEEEGNRLVAEVNGNIDLSADDAESIVASGRDFVKKGNGVLYMRGISDFVGDIWIEEGVLAVTGSGQLGKDNVGAIHILSGATLRNSSKSSDNNGRIMTGKTVYLEGEGFAGKGAITGGSGWSTSSGCRFVLTGDAFINISSEFNFINSFDLAGHDLRGYQSSTTSRFGFSGSCVTNSSPDSATFTFEHGLLLLESGFTFYGANNVFNFVGGTSSGSRGTIMHINSHATFQPPVYISGYTTISGRYIVDNANSIYNRLKGDLRFSGDVLMANYTMSGTNTMINIEGSVSGDGHWLVKPGWLNLRAPVNTFSGTVDIEGTSEEFRAGLRLAKGAGYAAAKTTFTDADFELAAETDRAVPPVEFDVSGDYGNASFRGGSYYGARPVVAALRKSGAGTLDLVAGVTVTGRTEVVAGTLRFPSRDEHCPIYGYPGLMCLETNVYVSSLNTISPVYDIYCPRGNELTHYDNVTPPLGPRTTGANGYLWNRDATNVVMTFWAHHNDYTWLWIDDEAVFDGLAWGDSGSTADPSRRFKSVTLTPGPHRFVCYTSSSKTSRGPLYVTWTSETGSIYDSLPMYRGEVTDNTLSRIVYSVDDGDGRYFTLDDTPTSELDAVWLAGLDEAAFAPGATFDLGGYDYTLPVLEGAPTVVNSGTLTVTEAFRVSEAAAGAGVAATIDGVLAFADGAVVDLADFDRFAESPAVTEALKNGFKFVTAAGGITGTPVLSESLQAKGATLEFADDYKSLVLTVSPVKDISVVIDGDVVRVGAKIDRRPIRDVRIHVYRDGVEIDERKLGAGYTRYEGSWTYPEDGYYIVTVDVANGEQVIRSGVGAVRKRATAYRYVSPSGNDGDNGTSEESAMAGIQTAVDSLGAAGGYVYLLPGVYAETALTNCVTLTNAVKVIGVTADPSEVTVGRDSQSARIFFLNHADAAVRMVSMEYGMPPKDEGAQLSGSGGNVWVGEKGGTVENCVLRYGNTGNNWGAGGGNIYLAGGRIANCVLIGGKNNAGDNTVWGPLGGALAAFGSSIVENCLVTGCRTEEKMPWKNGGTVDGKSAVPVALYGNAKMVNCTIAGNKSEIAGAVSICRHSGSVPTVANCAFYDNEAWKGTNEFASVMICICNYRNSTPYTTAAEAMGAFTNCAAAIALNESCHVITAPGFVDPAGSDYRLTEGSPLVDLGLAPGDFGATSAFGIDGNPRRIGAAVDLGCFELLSAVRLEDREGIIFYLR